MTPRTDGSSRLIDGFIDLLAYVQAFRSTAAEKQPSYETVRSEILRRLKESDRLVENGIFTAEDHNQARYAVCAWIDESILGSAWSFKARWRPELLQRIYYRSADAGEQFFNRLNDLAAHERGIREVYYLCLALGFKGRYCDPLDADSLDILKKRHLALLFNGAFDSPSIRSLEDETLFPEAYRQKPLEKRSPASHRRWAWSAVFGVPALVFITLFLIFHFTLFSIGENILKAAPL